MSKIEVDGVSITIMSLDEKDYISLTDMVRNIDNGSALIEKWLRNKNTIEFLGIWNREFNLLLHKRKIKHMRHEILRYQETSKMQVTIEWPFFIKKFYGKY